MISVIIPCLNEEKYLDACLTSLKKSPATCNYEIIVVDNNSTDKTKEIALKHGVIVISEEKQGLTIAKNTGARQAKGEILYFLDADCVVKPNQLEKICRLTKKYPSIAIFGEPYTYTDGGLFIRFLTEKLKYFVLFHYFIKLISGVPYISGGNMAIRKQTLLAVEGFNEEFKNILLPEDVELSIRLYLAGHKARYMKALMINTSYRRYKGKSKLSGFIRLFATLKLIVLYRLKIRDKSARSI